MAALVTSCPVDFEQFLLDFRKVKAHLEAQKQIIDAHIVDFFTANHWDTLVSPDLRKDLLRLSDAQLCSLHSTNVEETKKAELLGENLLDFIRQARISQLGSFSWVKERHDYVSGEHHNFISHVMAPKKAYEVERMAEVIYFLSKKYDVRKILDLGSGKGYLSQALALQYGLPVVGVDSSDSNTQSAQKRNEKLLKAWRGLLRKSKAVEKSKDEESRQLCSCCTDTSSDGKHWHLFTSSGSCYGALCDSSKSENSFSINPCSSPDLGVTCRNCESGSVDPSYAKSPMLVSHSSFQQTSEQIDSLIDISQTNSYSCDVPVEDSNSTKCVSGHQVHLQGSSEKRNTTTQNDRKFCNSMDNLASNAQALKQKPIVQGKHLNSYIPVTGFVDKSLVCMGELERLFSELGQSDCGGESQSIPGLFLIGLHTCGDLAPTALKLFTSEPNVKVICFVGCCYHLLTQKFGASNAETDPGFPMSEFLKQQHFAVSRNATMIAQQAADRVASQTKLPPKSVLHRAILQVILKERFGLDGRGLHVGKIASKCKSFTEYVRKGLDKLGMQGSQGDISDEEISGYLRCYENKFSQIKAFHQLRVVVSPCVESIFLMDRLCFLYEQGFTKANIVQLFDAVKSPRCYAIIAAKDQ